jgi:hypothetical protein
LWSCFEVIGDGDKVLWSPHLFLKASWASLVDEDDGIDEEELALMTLLCTQSSTVAA